MASRNTFRSLGDLLPPVSVGSAIIETSFGARNLGVYFDCHLDMRKHINNVSRQCYFQLRQLRVIRRTLPSSVLKTLLHAFVSSRLEYCNSLFFGLPKCDLKKLQSVQNAAARLFGGLWKYDHITPIMQNELHWLPIAYRIEYKIAVLVFKSLHQQAPNYLTEMCRPALQSICLSRNRSASNGELVPHSWKTVHYGRRGFNYAAPTVWNKLPLSLRQKDSLTSFKKDLKTYYFRKAY